MSYKGEQDKKKILDVNGFHLQVPPIEYHDVTWTWLDLLLNVKSRVKASLLEQAIKQVRLFVTSSYCLLQFVCYLWLPFQKMGMKSHTMIHSSRISGGSTSTLNLTGGADHSFNDDEEKAKLLLGMVQQPKHKDKKKK